MVPSEMLTLLLFTLLIFLAFCGNVLVCIAIFYDRKLRRQPENLFLVSLAVSDLFVSLLVMVFAAANDLLGYWPFGERYCQFWICMDITCSTASILNLCAIAFDRFLHISRPMRYARYVNRGVILLAILVVWLLSTFIGAAQIIFGSASTSPPPPLTIAAAATSLANHSMANRQQFLRGDQAFDIFPYHLEAQCHLNLSPFYAISSSILSFFLPATIMIALYTKLYLYARMHVRSIRAQLKQATSLLIMQLASDRIRQVVVRPSCYLPPTQRTTLRSSPAPISHHHHHRHKEHHDSYQAINLNNNENSSDANGNCCAFVNVTAMTTGDCYSTVGMVGESTATVAATIIPCDRVPPTPTSDFNYNTQFIDFCESGGKRTTSSGGGVSDQKARLTLGIIMGTFMICWLPFFVINIWRSLNPDFFSQRVFQVVTWLGYANSTANPVIYPLFNRDFRRAFRQTMTKVCYCLGAEAKTTANGMGANNQKRPFP